MPWKRLLASNGWVNVEHLKISQINVVVAGNKALELRKQGKTVLFAFEIDIGFMCVPEILDKDGISAAAHFTTLCSFVYK